MDNVGSGEVSDRDYVIFASYGNDSIALMQYMHEQGYGPRCYVVYSDTKWAAPWWTERVEQGEELARRYGMLPVRIESEGWEEMVRRQNFIPSGVTKACTRELKIKPAQVWLDQVDPERELICCVGIRRAESARRSQWPEHTAESRAHGGVPSTRRSPEHTAGARCGLRSCDTTMQSAML